MGRALRGDPHRRGGPHPTRLPRDIKKHFLPLFGDKDVCSPEAISPDHIQANVGAVLALLLAMTAQVVSHLIEAGYMAKGPFVVVAVSAVPPLVTAHTLHLASVSPSKPVPPPLTAEPEAVTANVSRAPEPPWKPPTPKCGHRLSSRLRRGPSAPL
ncbi:hypothetical protein [Streptomyces sp. NPDC018610]|uniref:hypothetical protein n=1 Tax=Streptomyces sp. NPDC018610 TaxID=3365049 RepID=UPI0037AD4122